MDKKQNWKTIVLMALNGAGVSEEESNVQIRVITPMIEDWLEANFVEKNEGSIYDQLRHTMAKIKPSR